MEFKAILAQYYKDQDLVEEFDAMWEFMMGCYMYINKIIMSKNEQDFTHHHFKKL